VVCDAVALAWARRSSLRLVVVPLPDESAFESAAEAAAVASGGKTSRGGGRRRSEAEAARQHAEAAISVMLDAEQHGSVLAGTASDVMALLQQIVEGDG